MAATEVVHLNGSKQLDCLIRQLDINSIKIDKKKCTSLNEGPVFQSNSSVSGLAAVARALTKKSSQSSLLGTDVLEQAEVDQWLHYCVSQYAIDKSAAWNAMNDYLNDKVYFINNKLTLADIFVYTFLERDLEHFTAADKESHSNLLRWFDLIQRTSKVRQKPPLLLQRTPLY
eukprot:TCONS_00030874-protein